MCNLVCAQPLQNPLLMKSIGDQVREYRTQHGLNAAQFAKLVGTRRQNIEQLEEAGNRIPKYLGKLAEVLGISADEMLAKAGLRPPLTAAAKAKEPKGAFIHALSTEEEELLAQWRNLLGKDRRAKLQEITELAKERQAEKEELFERAGVTDIMERAANATRRRAAATSVTPGDPKLRQQSLLDDQK